MVCAKQQANINKLHVCPRLAWTSGGDWSSRKGDNNGLTQSCKTLKDSGSTLLFMWYLPIRQDSQCRHRESCNYF